MHQPVPTEHRRILSIQGLLTLPGPGEPAQPVQRSRNARTNVRAGSPDSQHRLCGSGLDGRHHAGMIGSAVRRSRGGSFGAP
jgi:hypothetical protein